ncbi:flagellar basal body rod protein FlgC [Litoreibacter albidus]|uniref:Flagellar basal-body rod protein FlgC n=1 Tax=Litoreibacter albidus TaxID=670155 RepID=A0A1H2VIH9_9RHOB|nr:flagellar basal body rod protein FlgC [Litoreibacter albidus]SDW68030.1 flagellar basal-body rod protein FlgC [Litoreibacter albidus]
MSEISQSLAISASGMRAHAARLRLTSENLANVNTPGYRRKVTSFEQEFKVGEATGLVRKGKTNLDQSELPKIHDPSHPLADAGGYIQGSNVNLMIEIADAREAQRSYEANLKMFEQTRKMSSALLDILRR